MSVDAVIAVVLVTESQSVPNWKLSKTNKLRISDVVITWPAMQLTIKRATSNWNILYISFKNSDFFV